MTVIQPPAPVTPPAVDPRDQQIADLQKQLKESQTNLEKTNDFVQKASVIIETITADPTLTTQVKSAIQAKTTPPAPTPPVQPPTPPATPPAPATPPQAPTISEESALMRENIIKNVEAAFGYDSATDEQKKEIRAKIAKRFSNIGMDVRTVPLTQLEPMLKDYYTLEEMPKAKEEGRLEGLVEAHTNSYGAFPSMNTKQADKESVQVTPEQKKWAGKLDVPLDKVEANLKELTETGKVSYPGKPQAAAPGPAPSGTPTPPSN